MPMAYLGRHFCLQPIVSSCETSLDADSFVRTNRNPGARLFGCSLNRGVFLPLIREDLKPQESRDLRCEGLFRPHHVDVQICASTGFQMKPTVGMAAHVIERQVNLHHISIFVDHRRGPGTGRAGRRQGPRAGGAARGDASLRPQSLRPQSTCDRPGFGGARVVRRLPPPFGSSPEAGA